MPVSISAKWSISFRLCRILMTMATRSTMFTIDIPAYTTSCRKVSRGKWLSKCQLLDIQRMRNSIFHLLFIAEKNSTGDLGPTIISFIWFHRMVWFGSYPQCQSRQFVTLFFPVFRTFSEALGTFKCFAESGEWDQLFPRWERNLMVGVGATAMFFIGKRLKKRHNLDDDVRQHIYDACNKWTNELEKKKTPFMGGNAPNLADLSFYGPLTCMEGCRTFDDIRKHTKLGILYDPWARLCNWLRELRLELQCFLYISDTWYEAMKKLVNANRGTVIHPINSVWTCEIVI